MKNANKTKKKKRAGYYTVGGDIEKTPASKETSLKKNVKESITKDVTEGLKKAKERKQGQELITAKERFDRLKSYMKAALDTMNTGKKLDSLIKTMSEAPFNFDAKIDEFYRLKIVFYVNEFKGDIVTMFEGIKKDIASMLEATEWSKKNFTISVNVDGKPETLNFMLLYIIMRHMFCIDLLSSLITSGGNELVNAKSIKYLHASLQATPTYVC